MINNRPPYVDLLLHPEERIGIVEKRGLMTNTAAEFSQLQLQIKISRKPVYGLY